MSFACSYDHKNSSSNRTPNGDYFNDKFAHSQIPSRVSEYRICPVLQEA